MAVTKIRWTNMDHNGSNSRHITGVQQTEALGNFNSFLDIEKEIQRARN